MNTFNQSIRDRLDKELRDKHFIPSDFHDIADKFDREYKDVSGTLHKLCNYGLLVIVKTVPNPTGKATKMYKVKPGAEFRPKSCGQKLKEYNDIIKARAETMKACADRLDKVMFGWVR